MVKLAPEDFKKLDTNSLKEWSKNSISFHLFSSGDDKRCLVYLYPALHYAVVIFNEGLEMQAIKSKLALWNYLLLFSGNKESDEFIELKNSFYQFSNSLDIEIKYYAQL